MKKVVLSVLCIITAFGLFAQEKKVSWYLDASLGQLKTYNHSGLSSLNSAYPTPENVSFSEDVGFGIVLNDILSIGIHCTNGNFTFFKDGFMTVSEIKENVSSSFFELRMGAIDKIGRLSVTSAVGLGVNLFSNKYEYLRAVDASLSMEKREETFYSPAFAMGLHIIPSYQIDSKTHVFLNATAILSLAPELKLNEDLQDYAIGKREPMSAINLSVGVRRYF